ncbi:MAG TPA: SRPBCC family protein [Methylomirabilota bacterium]|nr:SRPBCC family protein [Methylomirabilota bacterium]
MADYVLERRLWLPRPRPEVFEFFADVRNLEKIHPPWAGFRWVQPPPRIDAGAVVDFSVRVAGIRVRWRAIIREFDPPYRFVDAQLRGPFARWEHRHRFLEGPPPEGQAGVAGTWVEDRVTYRLPLGTLGRVVHALAVGRRIRALFDHRERTLRELLG